MSASCSGFGVILLAVFLLPAGTSAQSVPPSDRPQESITYWKPFEISPDEDLKVQEAHSTFKRLLLGWEETRIAPQLHVVRSDKGPWAASLDDGTILLSREAIDVCWREAGKNGSDRVAFVLAHELAHQRADHLWHRRFFRLAGQQPPQVRGRMLGGITADQLEVADLEAKETQADREGLLLMAMVGFNPTAVAGSDSRFFSEWIESIWGQPCGDGADIGECANAKSRFDRARAQWQDVARQAVLFDLGVQAYVGGQYVSARKFFTAYGREFPHREIHNNIGLTHIGEALLKRERIKAKGEDLGPSFNYPHILEEKPGVQPDQTRGGEGTRGPVDPEVARWREEMAGHFDEAASSFERAVKIDPNHRQSYWNLASTYLLAGNGPLAYGIVAGNYVKRFGQDAAASMLLGISVYLDDQRVKARPLLERAVAGATGDLVPLAKTNLAVYLGAVGDRDGARAVWKTLADWSRKQGDEVLFQTALQQMGKQPVGESSPASPVIEKVHGYRLGERITAEPSGMDKRSWTELWVEGERIQVSQFVDGSRMAIDANRAIIALWQNGGERAPVAAVRIGDDALKLGRVYGIPTRKIPTIRGEYRTYDGSGIAFYINDGKVAGWSLYRNDR